MLWVIVTSCMIYSIRKMRQVFSSLDQADYVVNERRMDLFLCLYAFYTVVFIGNSASQIILGIRHD